MFFLIELNGICISDDDFRQVRDKLDVNFQDSDTSSTAES
jgi:hypothetical protein